MKKLLTLLTVLTAFNANAGDHLNKFASDGIVPFYTKVDFAMQRELGQVESKLNDNMEANKAGSTAMALLPFDVNALSVAVANSESENAIAVGYSNIYKERIRYNVGINADTQGSYSTGVGVSYKF